MFDPNLKKIRTLIRITITLMAFFSIMFISLTATAVPQAFTFVRGIPQGDKAGHFLLFGIATLIVVAAFPGKRRTKLLVAAAVACYVVVDESLQIFAPTRSFELLDLFANLSGVATFGAVGLMNVRKDRPGKPTANRASHP